LQTLTKRSDIAKEFTWDLESIYPNNDAWENSFKKIEQRLPELEALKGTLAQSGQALLKVLQTRDELFEELETLYVYASMQQIVCIKGCLIVQCNCSYVLQPLFLTLNRKFWLCRKQLLIHL